MKKKVRLWSYTEKWRKGKDPIKEKMSQVLRKGEKVEKENNIQKTLRIRWVNYGENVPTNIKVKDLHSTAKIL